MKHKIILAAVIVASIGLGVGGTLLVRSSATASPACSGSNPGAESHNVMIMDNKVEPSTTTAKLCDTLTFTNMDPVTREIAFGPHEHHVPYDGIAAQNITDGQSFTITLNQAGSFRFHDHMHDEVQGYFTVTK